jgi:vacuolar protein sorting-associated protein 54
LEPLQSNMGDLRHRIGAGFQKQFVETLLADLREHVKKVPTDETLQRFTKSFQRDQLQRLNNRRSTDGQILSPAAVPPAYSELSDTLRFKLKQHLTNLQKAQHISSAIQAYRDEVSRELRNLIRQYLPSDDDSESIASGKSGTTIGGRGNRNRAEKSAALARAIRNLGPIEAEELLTQTYVGVSELTRRLGTQQKLLLDVTMTLGETQVGGMLSPPLQPSPSGFFNGRPQNGNGPGVNNQEDAAAVVFSGLSDIIAPVLEMAQSKLVKVVRIRKEQVSRYRAEDFYRYLTLNKLFSSECEAVSGRIPNSLQTAIGDQIVDFIHVSNEDRKNTLADMMEKEKWSGKDFDEGCQNILSRILEGATRDPEWWNRHSILYENSRSMPEPKDPIEELFKLSADPKDKIRHAIIDEQRYVLPGASLVLLQGIEKYLEQIIMIPSMAAEIATNMIDYIAVQPPPH